MMSPVRALAALMTLAVLGAPVVLDTCLLSCQATDQDHEVGDTDCHGDQAAPAAVRMPSSSCGHDHHTGVEISGIERGAYTPRLVDAIAHALFVEYPVTVSLGEAPLQQFHRPAASSGGPARPLRI
jgi:hypothetical protein